MTDFLFHAGATATCPHGGQVSITSNNTHVLVNGQAVATIDDTYSITGCAFTVPPNKPQPCVSVQWLKPASRVMVGGKPVILQTSTGICQSAEKIPQGPPNIASTQTKVTGK